MNTSVLPASPGLPVPLIPYKERPNLIECALQAHGVLWAANPSDTPVNWPIAPPIVAGKVTNP